MDGKRGKRVQYRPPSAGTHEQGRLTGKAPWRSRSDVRLLGSPRVRRDRGYRTGARIEIKAAQARARSQPVPRQKPTPWKWVILTTVDTALNHLYSYSITGLDHYTGAPGTLAVSNHRRDSDGPLLGSVLLRRENGRIVAPLPHFVAREDLFEKGFLAHYLRRYPAGLRPILKRINLRCFLTGAGAYPLQRTHERSIAEALQDVMACLGDMPVADVLRPRSLAILADALPAFDPRSTMAISRFLRAHAALLWKKRYGYRHLQLPIFRLIKPHLRDSVEHQLDHFTHLLEHGQTVILEPEGRLSLDGALRRPRAALHELVNRPQRPVRVLPISITYDALTTGHTRIFFDIRPELAGLGGLPRRTLDKRIMATIRSGCRVTAGQLAAGFLLFQSGTDRAWTATALFEHVHAAARRCHEAGISIDPCLLDRQDCEQRMRDLVAWGRRTQFLADAGRGRLRVTTPAAPPPWVPYGSCTLIDYLRTELLETVGCAHARDLELLP